MEGGSRYNDGPRFSIGRIIGDPFALATISIAIVSRSSSPTVLISSTIC
jgi:SHO1 osmosensor